MKEILLVVVGVLPMTLAAQTVIKSASIANAILGTNSASAWTIPADSFLSFDSGTAGTLVETNMLNAQTRNAIGTWTAHLYPMTNFWVSNNFAPAWPASVNVHGTVYTNVPTTTWVLGFTNWGDYVVYTFPDPKPHYCLIGGFVNFMFPLDIGTGFNPLVLVGQGGDSATPNVDDQSSAGHGVAMETTVSGNGRRIFEPTNHWVWWSVVYSNGAMAQVQLWEPTNQTQISLTSHTPPPITPTNDCISVDIGRYDTHPYSTANTWMGFSGMVIVTNPALASFPLLPWNIPLDRTAGSCTITNPGTDGMIITNQAQVIYGTASDVGTGAAAASGVGVVMVSLDNVNWYDATGTTNWSYSTNLALGTNIIYVKSEDNMGNVSAVTNRTVDVVSSFTLQDSISGTTTGNSTVGKFSGDKCNCVKFIASSSYTITKIEANMQSVGSPNYTLTASVWTDSGDQAGTQIGTGSAGVSTTTLTGTESAIPFTGISAAVTSGTTNWICISASTSDSSNYAEWDYITANLANHNLMSGSSCPATGVVSNLRRAKALIYSGGP